MYALTNLSKTQVLKTLHRYLLALLCAGISCVAEAQSLTPQAVTAAGATMTQSNGSLHFTVGELVVETLGDADGNTLGSGFTNAAASSTIIVSVEQTREELWTFTVYPNPSSDRITLDWKRGLRGNIRLAIVDLQGREVMSRSYPGSSNHMVVETSVLAPGTYLLQLYHADTDAYATVKFIKTHH